MLSRGDLWQSVFIGPPRKEHIPLILIWLTRAGDCPLAVWLFQSDRPCESELQATNEVLSLLVERLHRWKEIVFCLPAAARQPLLDLPHGAAVSLEAACINTRDWDQTSADNLWRSLHSSPTLRRPDWASRYRHGPPSHAPWVQLTHITLEGLLAADVVLSTLRHCENVVELILPHLIPSGVPFDASPFVLPALRTLRISTETDLGSLFQSLLLPSLVSLDISYRPQAHTTSQLSTPLADLVSRSQCQLSKLTLCDNNDPPEDALIDYLRSPALQSIVELRLYNLVTDKTVSSLSCREGKKHILPRLQVVALRCCTSDGILSAMIASCVPSLRTCHSSRWEGLVQS